MGDLGCCQCGASIAVSEHPGVFQCGHMRCRNCGLGARCPLDGSLCIWNEVDIAIAIGEIREAYNSTMRQNDPDWSLYYAAVNRLREVIQQKYPQFNTNSQAKEPIHRSLSASLPHPCPHCHIPMAGHCLRCESFPASASGDSYLADSDTWRCSICSYTNKASDYICKTCSGHRLLKEEARVDQGKYWKCTHCGYKYNTQSLQECADCHTSHKLK